MVIIEIEKKRLKIRAIAASSTQWAQTPPRPLQCRSLVSDNVYVSVLKKVMNLS